MAFTVGIRTIHLYVLEYTCHGIWADCETKGKRPESQDGMYYMQVS